MSEFYYKILPGGNKSYYNSYTGAAVRKRSIPPNIRETVPKFDSHIHMEQHVFNKKRRKQQQQAATELLNNIKLLLEELDDDVGPYSRINHSDIPVVLSNQGISTKKEWKTWLLKNHPDKVKDSDDLLLKDIITAGRGLGW